MIHSETDPAFNLAAEEYLLNTAQEDCFMVWRNHRAIVVGRNQNTASQINADFVKRHGIRVVRRISGGGAVYHDLGNVNFTFIKVANRRNDIEFVPYTRPILSFLKRLSVPAVLDGRSDLTIDGLKISGNAQHLHKNRVLVHGTLLFDADLAMLAAALRVGPATYIDKAVQSRRSRVTNIRSHLATPLSVEAFMEALLAHIRSAFDGMNATFSAVDRSAIHELAQAKYRRWEWNYGTSPDYDFHKSARTPGGTIAASLKVQEGLIQALHFQGEYFGTGDIRDVEALLAGCRHSRKALKARLVTIDLKNYMRDVSVDHLLEAMF